MKKEKTFRVEVVSLKNQKVVSVIGRGLTEKQAERREATGLTRINADGYFINTVEE